MPCYTIQRMSVKLTQSDRGLLKKALTKLGYEVRESGQTLYAYGRLGNIEINKDVALVNKGQQSLIEQLNMAYAKIVVDETAAQFDMVVEEENEYSGTMVMYEYA